MIILIEDIPLFLNYNIKNNKIFTPSDTTIFFFFAMT
jgi:hypothetical protein